MSTDPDDDWYFDNILVHAQPGQARVDISAIGTWQAWWAQRYQEASDPVATLARTQGFVVDSPDLRHLGWQQNDTRRQIRRGVWWAPARTVISTVVPPAGDDKHLTRRRRCALTSTAAALLHADHVISGRSAAILQGLPTMTAPTLPELTAPKKRTTGRHTKALVRCNDLPGRHVTSWYGAPVTTTARTIVDLARHDKRDGIMAADAALREGLVTRQDIDEALTHAAGQRGVRQARTVLALASPLAESPLESVVRLALREDGFPEPELQAVVRDGVRSRTYRLDMLFREQRLVIEIDGMGKYDAAEIKREKLRESRLRALGYRIERVLWEDVLHYWPQTRSRLAAALGIAPGKGTSRAS